MNEMAVLKANISLLRSVHDDLALVEGSLSSLFDELYNAAILSKVDLNSSLVSNLNEYEGSEEDFEESEKEYYDYTEDAKAYNAGADAIAALTDDMESAIIKIDNVVMALDSIVSAITNFDQVDDIKLKTFNDTYDELVGSGVYEFGLSLPDEGNGEYPEMVGFTFKNDEPEPEPDEESETDEEETGIIPGGPTPEPEEGEGEPEEEPEGEEPEGTGTGEGEKEEETEGEGEETEPEGEETEEVTKPEGEEPEGETEPEDEETEDETKPEGEKPEDETKPEGEEDPGGTGTGDGEEGNKKPAGPEGEGDEGKKKPTEPEGEGDEDKKKPTGPEGEGDEDKKKPTEPEDEGLDLPKLKTTEPEDGEGTTPKNTPTEPEEKEPEPEPEGGKEKAIIPIIPGIPGGKIEPEPTDGEGTIPEDIVPGNTGEPEETPFDDDIIPEDIIPESTGNPSEDEDINPFAEDDDLNETIPGDGADAILELTTPIGGNPSPYDLSELDPTDPNTMALKKILGEYDPEALGKLGLDPETLIQMVKDGRNPLLALLNAIGGMPLGLLGNGKNLDEYDLSDLDPDDPNTIALKKILGEYDPEALDKLGLDPETLIQMVKDGRNPLLALLNAISGLPLDLLGNGKNLNEYDLSGLDPDDPNTIALKEILSTYDKDFLDKLGLDLDTLIQIVKDGKNPILALLDAVSKLAFGTFGNNKEFDEEGDPYDLTGLDLTDPNILALKKIFDEYDALALAKLGINPWTLRKIALSGKDPNLALLNMLSTLLSGRKDYKNGLPVGDLSGLLNGDPYGLTDLDPTDPNVIALKRIFELFNEEELIRMGIDPAKLVQMVREGKNPILVLIGAASGIANSNVDDKNAFKGKNTGQTVVDSKTKDSSDIEKTIGSLVSGITSRTMISLVLTGIGIVATIVGYLLGGISVISPIVFGVIGLIAIVMSGVFAFNRYLNHIVDLLNGKNKKKLFGDIAINMKDSLVLAGVGLVSTIVTFILGSIGILNFICFAIAGLVTAIMTALFAFNKYLSKILNVDKVINDSILSENNKDLLREFLKSKNGFNLKILGLLLILLFTFILQLFGKISWLWLLILLLIILILIVLIALSLEKEDEKKSMK